MRYVEGQVGVGQRLAFYFLTMIIVWNAAVVSIAMVWSICVIQGALAQCPGFFCGAAVGCSWVLACLECLFSLVTAVKSQWGCSFGSVLVATIASCRGLHISSQAFL